VRDLRRRARSGDRGAASLEYLVVASAIIVLIGCLAVGGGQRTVSNGFATLFCKVQQAVGGGGTCSVPPSARNADYKPSSCQMSASAVNVKVAVKAFSVALGQDAKMTTTYNSDGTVSVSISNEGALGVEVALPGAKANADAGAAGSFRAGAEGKASATLKGQTQQTWDFKNAAEAAEFRGDLQRRFAVEVANGPATRAANWLYETVFDGTPLRAPTSQTIAGGGEVAAEGSFNVPIVGEAKAGGKAGIVLSTTTGTDNGRRYKEVAVAMDLSGTASANLFGAEAGGERKGTGVMTVRRDDTTGKPIRVTFAASQTGNFKVALGQPPGLMDFADLKHLIKQNGGGGGQDSVVATTTLDLDTPERRAAFEEWNDGVSAGRAASSAWDALWAEPGSDAHGVGGEFGRLLSEQGKTSVVTYDGSVVSYGGGVEASAGIKFGADAGVGKEDSKATSAHYLGAPDSAGNREVVNMPDCVPK
jgi:hypothetical protein